MEIGINTYFMSISEGRKKIMNTTIELIQDIRAQVFLQMQSKVKDWQK